MIAVVRTSLVLALLLASSCSFYLSEPRVPKTDLRATLGGAYEVPPTQSRGSGYFEAVYRPSTKVLEYPLNLVGLSGPITVKAAQAVVKPMPVLIEAVGTARMHRERGNLDSREHRAHVGVASRPLDRRCGSRARSSAKHPSGSLEHPPLARLAVDTRVRPRH